MPFGQPLPRSFSAQSIRNNAPAVPGVFGISNARQWILIERTHNIRAALLAHLMDSNGTVNALAPTGFTYEECDVAMQTSREDRLVFEYEPVANRLHR